MLVAPKLSNLAATHLPQSSLHTGSGSGGGGDGSSFGAGGADGGEHSSQKQNLNLRHSSALANVEQRRESSCESNGKPKTGLDHRRKHLPQSDTGSGSGGGNGIGGLSITDGSGGGMHCSSHAHRGDLTQRTFASICQQ